MAPWKVRPSRWRRRRRGGKHGRQRMVGMYAACCCRLEKTTSCGRSVRHTCRYCCEFDSSNQIPLLAS